jgi:hypothetical protein
VLETELGILGRLHGVEDVPPELELVLDGKVSLQAGGAAGVYVLKAGYPPPNSVR